MGKASGKRRREPPGRPSVPKDRDLRQRGPDPEEPEPASGFRGVWLLLLAPALAVVASLTLGYLWNEDFWWYLTSGRQVLEQGRIPSQDPFLYTSGQGIGWVYHSWLWTVVVAGLERLAGLEGVVVFHMLLAVGLSILVYTAGRVDRLGLVNALALTLFLVTIGPRLAGKAEVASWLMLAIFFRLLEREGTFTWKRGAVLGGLQVLWANLHGGYPLGIFIALCYGVGGWIEARRGGGSPGRPPLWFPALLFVLALADPWHFSERLAPFGFVTGSEELQPTGESGTNLILEWRSPFHPTSAGGRLPWLYGLAAGAGLGSFVAARRWPVPRLFFFLGMAALGATAVRHLPGLALAAALVILRNLEERGRAPRPARRDRTAKRGVSRGWAYAAACGLLAVVLLGAAVALLVARPGFEGGQSASFFTVRPVIACPQAADFILENDLPGPIFNDYPMGAYLTYRLWPKHRLFIDSRVLDPSVVARYTRMVDSPESWRQAESRYGFRTVVLGNYSRTVRSPLGMTLLRDRRWRLVYADPLAVILVKDGPSIPPVFRLGLPEAGGRDPFVPPRGFVPPLPALQRAFLNDFPANYLVEYLAILGQLGRTGEVVQLATRALETLPDHPLLYRQRCAAHLVEGATREAVDDCTAAYRQIPEDAQVVTVYAMALHRAGRRDEALAVLRKALRENQFDPTLQQTLQSLGRSS
jgi:hypothetical protein